MDLLANYDDENTGDNSVSESPKHKEEEVKSNLAPNVLENEWLSFEQMIAPGGVVGNSEPVKSSDFLVNGIVAYPGMKGSASTAESGLALEEQSSASSDSETEADKLGESKPVGNNGVETEKKDEGDDDAFFRLRKQVKERDRSSSSDRSGSTGSSSASSSRSGSPSPPHLSPVNSIKSHTSDPPDLTERDDTEAKSAAVQIDIKLKDKKEQIIVKSSDEKKQPRSKERKRSRSRSRDRKKSHRDHRSKHDHSSSKSKRRRSRSRSKDRKRRRSRDHHRHKDKKSRDRKPSRSDEKRSKSRERKDSKSESRKSEGRDRKESTSDKKVSEAQSKTDVKKSETKDGKDSKSDSHRKRSRSRSKDRKDKKKDRRRSRSRHRHRSRSKERRSKERKRSRSKERRRSRSKDRKRKHRSRSGERSRHKSRDRHSRSRSRERLRSRSPVMGRKLTFKEQMRKEFINASKGMTQEHKVVSDLDSLRKPGEALRPSDLLKGVKLTGGESVTPQMALIQTMAAMHKKAQELTGVEVPKYYNPAAVNPLKYAEQVQKRKLLWSKKTEEKDKNDQMETQWKSAFVATEDNKTASKFRKLMGMKEGEGQVLNEELPEDVQKQSEEQQRKQAELFQRLDQEYQFARMTTHTQRGVGLGFSTTVIDPNHPQNPP